MTIGREVRLPADVMFGHTDAFTNGVADPCNHVQALKDKMRLAHETARKHLAVNAKRSKETYDARLSFHSYKVGDLVWYLHEARRPGVMPKLQKTYDGPFVVKEKRSELNLVIQMDKNGKDRGVHHNKLKTYLGNPPKWVVSTASRLKSD